MIIIIIWQICTYFLALTALYRLQYFFIYYYRYICTFFFYQMKAQKWYKFLYGNLLEYLQILLLLFTLVLYFHSLSLSYLCVYNVYAAWNIHSYYQILISMLFYFIYIYWKTTLGQIEKFHLYNFGKIQYNVVILTWERYYCRIDFIIHYYPHFYIIPYNNNLPLIIFGLYHMSQFEFIR